MKKFERIAAFTHAIWTWYDAHKRTLPWRDLHVTVKDDTRRAYFILVSEVMLQQTQVSRVTVLFPRFLAAFPDLASLAKAGNKEVVVAWQGLGYNMRALRLRDAARMIQERHEGVFPQDMDDLLRIKGIGPYTAGAIRNFAFNLPTPCIDTNIERILLRVFYGPSVQRVPPRTLLDLASQILDHALDPDRGRDARNWHAALMDFGSLVCTKTSPRYDACPLMKQGLYRDPHKIVSVSTRPEPHRGGIPNRIFRGRIVERLRSSPRGIPSGALGPAICDDWGKSGDGVWLDRIVKKLLRDELIEKRKGAYVLRD